MSRAFTKERDDAPEPALALPESPHPNLVTAAGLAALEARRRDATEPREIAYLDQRLASAIRTPPPKNRRIVAFGARVRVRGEDGFAGAFTICGEDEADVAHGKIGYRSPLALALMGARRGDVVVWNRPVGDLRLHVEEITYADA
ncbi:MAG: GreA/GreB family elongation factor [Vulcanimicrobiaceae bacterium]